MRVSFAECSARERIAHVVDAHTFEEFLPPHARLTSPHLPLLGVPCAFDDGVAIGRARIDGHAVLIAAQEGGFMGGGVGEVHGAKLTGLLKKALKERPKAVVLLAESGGVRLHEANAGLIGVSEVMRAVLDTRAAGVPVICVIGGNNGCFGGMGIVARCADHIIMSDVGRLAMSGPEVIEASHGVEEYDARDKGLVWRTCGGKHRYLTGDCNVLVEDDADAFKQAIYDALARDVHVPLTIDTLEAEHALLKARCTQTPGRADALDIWTRMGIDNAHTLPERDVAQVLPLKTGS